MIERMRNLFARIVGGGRVMEGVKASAAIPKREPVLVSFRHSFGIDADTSPSDVAREAESRVAQQGLPPGRVVLTGERNVPRIVSYSSAFEAALDFRKWHWEIEKQNAESVCEAARDDVAGGFGDEVALSRAQLVVERWRERLSVAERLWPLAEYIALSLRLRDATLEAAMLAPDAMVHKRYAPVDVPQPQNVSRHPFREAEPFDHGRAAAARMAAREFAALDVPTPYSMARGAVRDLESRLARWREAHPMLAAMLDADGERGLVTW